MKIEIDLNDILGDECGAETLAEAVRRQVIEKMSSEIRTNIGKRIDAELSKVINETIREHITKFMPDTIAALLDAEYVMVDRYGDRAKEPTTFRKQLVKHIHEQMVYKESHYSSDENAFTKAIKGVVGDKVASFRSEFNTTVDSLFTKQCLEHAQKYLQKKLGIQ